MRPNRERDLRREEMFTLVGGRRSGRAYFSTAPEIQYVAKVSGISVCCSGKRRAKKRTDLLGKTLVFLFARQKGRRITSGTLRLWGQTREKRRGDRIQSHWREM